MLFENSAAGFAAVAGNADDIVDNIRQLKNDGGLRADMCERGPRYARAHLDRSVLNRTLESSLRDASNAG